MIRLVLILVITGFLVTSNVSEARGDTFTYRDREYSTRKEAVRAVLADMRSSAAQIKKRTEIGMRLRIVTPNRTLTRKHGVQSGVFSSSEAVGYIVDVLTAGLDGNASAVKKSGLFKEVRHIKVSSTD